MDDENIVDLRAIKNAVKAEPDDSWFCDFELTKEEADMIAEPEFIYDDLIIQGHLIIIPAAPGAGKTTIALWVAEQLAPDFRVVYVNADTSGGDAKELVTRAEEAGYTMMLPDMKAGLSMNDIVTRLEQWNECDCDYSRYVLFLDTYKKVTDVIIKSRAKETLKMLRGLSAKGMTIILLAHTNKYTDADGMPIYEGTGDTRSDVDEMIYLIPKKNADGSMTVSTLPDKVRGSFEPITFHISADRQVTQEANFVDVISANQTEKQQEKDETVIEAITEAINGEHSKQIEITQYCKDQYEIGWRSVKNVLTRYSGKLWEREKLFQNHAWRYKLIKHSPSVSG